MATHTTDEIRDALNRAANDVIAAADLDDTGCVDALNLLVNATVDYLADPTSTLVDVVAANYDLSDLGDTPEEQLRALLQHAR